MRGWGSSALGCPLGGINLGTPLIVGQSHPKVVVSYYGSSVPCPLYYTDCFCSGCGRMSWGWCFRVGIGWVFINSYIFIFFVQHKVLDSFICMKSVL